MVVARYSCMINGFTSIAISKLDIMDTLEEVKIGVAYKLDGKLLESMPREFTCIYGDKTYFVFFQHYTEMFCCINLHFHHVLVVFLLCS